MHSEILKIEEELKSLNLVRDRVIRDVQMNCQHLLIAELPYKEDEWTHCHTPEKFVCEECGLAEEGWSTMYFLKVDRTRKVERDEFYRLQKGLLIERSDKGYHKTGTPQQRAAFIYQRWSKA